MNYYDELIENIDKLIEIGNIEEARKIVDEELSLPYIPRVVEDKLLNYSLNLKKNEYNKKILNDEQIIDYLNDDEQHQLIAVDDLSRKNIRDYIDICDDYLQGSGYKNAKALLIDSLIRQEINYEFTYINNNSSIKFNPSKFQIVEESKQFKDAIKYLSDYFFKDPSKLQLAIELLYKEAMLSLPNLIDDSKICNKIIDYINDAFSAK